MIPLTLTSLTASEFLLKDVISRLKRALDAADGETACYMSAELVGTPGAAGHLCNILLQHFAALLPKLPRLARQHRSDVEPVEKNNPTESNPWNTILKIKNTCPEHASPDPPDTVEPIVFFSLCFLELYSNGTNLLLLQEKSNNQRSSRETRRVIASLAILCSRMSSIAFGRKVSSLFPFNAVTNRPSSSPVGSECKTSTKNICDSIRKVFKFPDAIHPEFYDPVCSSLAKIFCSARDGDQHECFRSCMEFICDATGKPRRSPKTCGCDLATQLDLPTGPQRLDNIWYVWKLCILMSNGGSAETLVRQNLFAYHHALKSSNRQSRLPLLLMALCICMRDLPDDCDVISTDTASDFITATQKLIKQATESIDVVYQDLNLELESEDFRIRQEHRDPVDVPKLEKDKYNDNLSSEEVTRDDPSPPESLDDDITYETVLLSTKDKLDFLNYFARYNPITRLQVENDMAELKERRQNIQNNNIKRTHVVSSCAKQAVMSSLGMEERKWLVKRY